MALQRTGHISSNIMAADDHVPHDRFPGYYFPGSEDAHGHFLQGQFDVDTMWLLY